MTIYSAIFSLNYYKGFSVMRTFTIEETALFICNTTNKLCKSEKPSFYKNVIQSGNPDQKEQKDQKEEQKEQKEEEKEYVNVVKKVKKDNITEDNIGEIMLCQIPSVSSITAIAIMKKYNTICSLIKELETNKDCLKDICYTTAKDQTRKISKTSIENIIKFLLKK